MSVALGNELTPTQVKDKPAVQLEGSADGLYTLIMTDPDAPSRTNPVHREFLHWTVINIPGGDVAAGQEVFGYIGSGPPEKTGLHRYIFFLFKQNGEIQYTDAPVSSTYVILACRQFGCLSLTNLSIFL